ncbi:O-fucosyltransferase 23 [Sesamum alatum]|uniref:O-fucosyltransferase family protein n=1 Tax=Sesamum alatum TaxID=300844 RepID=A0AAE2CG59_9LAMI|nr:O-fucosyltransferase 23 [Sesamum alatum]
MEIVYCKNSLRFFRLHLMKSLACKCVGLVVIALVVRAVCLPRFSGYGAIEQSINSFPVNNRLMLNPEVVVDSGKSKFLEVPQIIWGLNNQKIAFARACLTARMLNRTLLMPSLSASLFYKEVDLLKPIPFDKVFQFERFNSRCRGFFQLARHSQVSNTSDVFEIRKGSGRRWTVEKDLEQLTQLRHHRPYDETIRIVGKHPFLWHDHWPVKDYAKVFECLEFVEEISREADQVVSKIREIGLEELRRSQNANGTLQSVPYVAVHMRIEKDWMIHCKKLEQRLNISEICSSKEQTVQRVGNIVGLKTPVVIYLAVADDLLEDNSVVLGGWKEGLVPFEKKKLGVFDMYKKQPYLIQSAIDYEVCLRSDVFVGNSFSTFSSLVVLDRTQRMMSMGVAERCGLDVRWPSYAYNLEGESKGARAWAANMSDLNLHAISYGSNQVSCP